MKFCPTCQTRYDEEILHFCIKDGTPLVDEEQPAFVEMPSEGLASPEEDDDDLGEQTIIRHDKPAVSATPPPPEPEIDRSESPRIVIPTSETKKEQQVRARNVPPYQSQRPSNTGKIVALTILGTMVVLVGIAGLFWFLRSDETSNSNLNANRNANLNANTIDTNLNTNLNLNGFNINTNTDLNANANTNVNANANLKSPTPTPTPKPTPTPGADNTNTETNITINTNSMSTPTPKTTGTPTPTPSTPLTPKPTPTAPPPGSPSRTPVSLGIMNGRAVSLPKPAYTSAARQVRANGQVAVQILVDEAGNVLSARATSGHPLLRQSAENAARQSKFNPIIVNNQPVKAVGILLYNFVN